MADVKPPHPMRVMQWITDVIHGRRDTPRRMTALKLAWCVTWNHFGRRLLSDSLSAGCLAVDGCRHLARLTPCCGRVTPLPASVGSSAEDSQCHTPHPLGGLRWTLTSHTSPIGSHAVDRCHHTPRLLGPLRWTTDDTYFARWEPSYHSWNANAELKTKKTI